MMMIIRTVVLLAFLATAGYAANEKPAKQAPLRPLAELIWDRNDFISRLPKKTLVYPHASVVRDLAGPTKELEAALNSLGDTPGVEFVKLPAGIDPPNATKTVKPSYPFQLRRHEISGKATFLVLVGSDGKVAALYCIGAKEKEFATAGAASLVRWSFKPSELNGTKVPVLVVIPMVFSIDGGI